MHAWVAGASGLVGSALVDLLLAHPQVGRVSSLVRRASQPRPRPGQEKLHERVIDFDRLQGEVAGMHATHVFCCLGTTIAKAGSEAAFRRVDYEYPLALAEAARMAGAQAFLVVTAIGADPGSTVFYNRFKGELERDLRGVSIDQLRIFRPSLLLGERVEHRRRERIAALVAKPLGGLLLGPLRKYRPIEARDVAKAMLAVALTDNAAGGLVIESDRIAALAAARASAR